MSRNKFFDGCAGPGETGSRKVGSGSGKTTQTLEETDV
jgi:hypothetical protein